jgi:hypothetical protein
VWRAETLYEAHRREPTRLSALAETWGYSPASSGLQQTVAALKQYGLLEEIRVGEDRKVQISDLARRILSDLRPGAREQALKEAGARPKLIAEYLPKWLPVRPSDAHCISELHFDRGFNQTAAKLFLKVFDETVSFADLRNSDKENEDEPAPADLQSEAEEVGSFKGGNLNRNVLAHPPLTDVGAKPLSERLQVVTTGNQLTVSAALVNAREVDKLIRILQANKLLLEDEEGGDDDLDAG